MKMNNTLIFLLKLSETDKKFIIALVLIICAILSIFIVLSLLIAHICKTQAKKADTLVHDYVVTGILSTKTKFLRVASRKNRIYFYRKARIPMLLILIHFIIALIFMIAINRYDYGALWGEYTENGIGFATIFYVFDFAHPTYGTFFGMEILSGFPLLNEPHFSAMAIVSYFIVPIFCVGIAWFFIEVQGFLARQIRILKLSKSIYSKRLDNIKLNPLNNINSNNNTIITKKDE